MRGTNSEVRSLQLLDIPFLGFRNRRLIFLYWVVSLENFRICEIPEGKKLCQQVAEDSAAVAGVDFARRWEEDQMGRPMGRPMGYGRPVGFGQTDRLPTLWGLVGRLGLGW